VQTAEGLAYTRRGTFVINGDRELVTASGERVRGDAGPIVIEGGEVYVDERGVVYSGDSQVGKLKTVDFANEQALVQTEGGLFKDPGDAIVKEESATVHSGYLEMSNTEIIKEMVAMIEVQRSFEAYQKVIQTISEQDKLATSRVGKLV